MAKRKLSESDVLFIRNRYSKGGEWTLKKLAERFNVHSSTVHQVLTGLTYANPTHRDYIFSIDRGEP